MAEHFNRRALADDIEVTHVKTLPASGGRERRISTTTSPRGDAVMVETFNREGAKVGGALVLFAREVPGMLSAMAEAGASIGCATSIRPTPQPDGAGLDRTLARARAL